MLLNHEEVKQLKSILEFHIDCLVETLDIHKETKELLAKVDKALEEYK